MSSLPFIVGSLHPKPNILAITKLIPQARGNFVANRLSLKQNVLQMLLQNPKVSCYLSFSLFVAGKTYSLSSLPGCVGQRFGFSFI